MDVFRPRLIDGIISGLRSFKDSSLRDEVAADPDLLEKLVDEYFYCG
jgi:hypothetical protein